MKREVFIHFSFWISIFIIISVIKNNLGLSYIPFFIGGVVGTILPDIDHLLYVYLIKPQELTSQRFQEMLKNKEIFRSVDLLYETREERKNLIFHTKFFQGLFLIVLFFVMSSSGSIFGKGLTLAFALHLAIDHMIDIYDLNRFDNTNEKIYWFMGMALTIVIGFM